ncbi:MAG TPA: hypothetical protein VN894_07320 [Polyangiaceae bacterium]|nr:hypothetical protein [Polyangiaceae bacterium]
MPREVGSGGAPDRRAESFVFDAREHPRELRGNRPLGGNAARDASFRRALERRKRADAEAERMRVDAVLAQASAHLFGKERELVRPHAARDA